MERSKNIFDKVGALIPGYRGYAEREGRRQCDKLLREKIVSVLEQCEATISARIDESVKSRNPEKAKLFEDNRKRLNTLTAKMKFSPYGASAFFSNSQIKEPELEQIYKKDLEILERVNSFKQAIEDKDSKDVDLPMEEIETLLNSRNQFIKEFK
jgi:hypothetical protein